MSNIELEDEDTSDDDYKPEGEDCAQLSEEESDGVPEENYQSDDESNKGEKKRKSRGKKRRSKKAKVDNVENEETDEKPQNTLLNEEEQKKRTDSLWADFLKDTNFKPKQEATVTTERKSTTKELNTNNKPVCDEPKAPKILEFAGEIVNIPKKSSDDANVEQSSSQVSTTSLTSRFRAKPVRGGLSSVLGQIGKKQKISTLEKSKLDWDSFKQRENLTEELHSHNKGKNGYLERQDFLQRADLRQFEIEKQARAIQRSNRS